MSCSAQSATVGTPLQHAFQRQPQSSGSQLHVVAGEPDLVTSFVSPTSEFETELILVDQPFAESLAAHGVASERAVALVNIAPVHLVRDLHSGELGADLRARELLEFLRNHGIECSEHIATEDHGHRHRYPFAHFGLYIASSQAAPQVRGPAGRLALAGAVAGPAVAVIAIRLFQKQ